MHIPSLFSSGRSLSPVSSNAVGVDVPKPKTSHRIRESFRFGRSRSQAPIQADPSGAIGVASSSRPSLNSSTSQQVQGGPVGADQDILDTSARPPSHSSQQSLLCPELTHSPQPRDEISDTSPIGQNIWNINERNVCVNGINNSVSLMINSSNKFMAELLDKTIQGAASDSSDRDPPPRCHPGTRLAIIARCLEFIANAAGKKKLRWVVGAAGVGKSAIMQNVAESLLPSVSERASIFLSINGRNDGAKIVMTLVYQLAAQCEPYREFVERKITRHPALFQSSLSVQFKNFLIEPFINTPLSNPVGRILIIVDGLDECDKPETQRELLRLITDMCSKHPSSPIVWIVASRPEHHITSFFSRADVQAVYEKEEILVDTDEARSDVERFLRAELTRIQDEFSLSLGSQWPREQDFWKLASASGGLFVYAQTVTQYIGALTIGDPISQLDDVLKVIDALPLSNVPRDQHPMALLDALYAQILSKVPERIMVNSRKILLALVLDLGSNPDHRKGGFLVLCNWLGMTCDEAYTAIRHLGSVLDPPKRDNAHQQKLRPFHKSFIDYISDFTRSGFSSNIKHEARQLEVQYILRIFDQARDGIDCGDVDPVLRLSSGLTGGGVACVPGAGSNIILTWPGDKDSGWSNKQVRWEVYRWALSIVVEGMKTGQSVSYPELCIRTVTTQLEYYIWDNFPWQELVNTVFKESRRDEFIKSGLLKRIPIKELGFTRMTWHTKLRFRRPSGTTTNLSDPWDPSCQHARVGDWGKGLDEDWMTEFCVLKYSDSKCHFCCQRLEQQLENWATRSPDHDVTVLLTSTQSIFIEFHFVDSDDGVSEWTYWIVLQEKHRKAGGTS